MKNKVLKKILCLALALILTLPFSSCGKKEKAFMELDGITLSEGVYTLMLSIQKGNMAYLINQYYGNHSSPEFWDTIVEAPSTTNDKYYTAAIFKKAEKLISSAALFDELNLKLPQTAIDKIDKEMSNFVDEFGGGKKDAFEGVLDGYGFTSADLREYKILNAKAEMAANELYGEKGEKIGTREYFANGQSIGTLNLLAEKNYKLDPVTFFINKLKAFFTSPWLYVLIILLIAFFVLAERRRRRILRKKRRDARKKRNRELINSIDR